MKTATFDTNSLIYAIQNKADILSKISEYLAGEEIQIIVPTGIKTELTKIIESKKASKADKSNAKIALEMLKKWKKEGKIKIVDGEAPLDKWFINLAGKQKYSIVTYDKKLRECLKSLGVQIITLKK